MAKRLTLLHMELVNSSKTMVWKRSELSVSDISNNVFWVNFTVCQWCPKNDHHKQTASELILQSDKCLVYLHKWAKENGFLVPRKTVDFNHHQEYIEHLHTPVVKTLAKSIGKRSITSRLPSDKCLVFYHKRAKENGFLYPHSTVS